MRMATFEADGNNLLDVWATTEAAFASARKTKKPAMIVYQGINRRFGHAATDRQSAYVFSSALRMLFVC